MKKLIIAFTALSAATTVFAGIRALSHDNYGGDPKAWQIGRHNEKMAIVAKGGAKVVFVGDSITHFFESDGTWKKYFSEGDMKALDLGTSADRTEHVLWRLNEGGELDGYKAKIVILMIGTNNAGHFPFEKEPPIDAILGIRAILDTIRAKQPQAKIVLHPIFPRGLGPDDQYRLRNDVVNKEIRKFADGQHIWWCDFTDQLLTFDGFLSRDLFPDLLHPITAGYEIWYSAVKPYIDAALSDGKIPMPGNRYAKFPRRGEFRIEEPEALFPVSNIMRERWDPGWWSRRLERNRNQIADSKGKIDLVFLGDSITHGWENTGKSAYAEITKKYSVLNCGYSGDRIEHLLWRAQNGELDGYEAKGIMIMIGTNNVSSEPKDIAEGIRRLLAIVAKKQPKAKVLLLPIFPYGHSAQDKHRQQTEKVNAIIKDFADGQGIQWVDFNAQFLDEKGTTKKYMPKDGLHPNADGYEEVWLPAVLPLFDKICGK